MLLWPLVVALTAAPPTLTTSSTNPTPTSLPTTAPPSLDPAAIDAARVQEVVLARQRAESDHLKRLGLWGASNVVAGAGLLALGSPGVSPLEAPPPALRGFGIQSLGWGAVNLAIAGIGLVGGAADTALTREEALAAEDDNGKVLWVNVGLDVGYMMAGGVLIAAGASGAQPAVDWTAHGAGVVTQGLGLLVLDVVAVWGSADREEALQALPPTSTTTPPPTPTMTTMTTP
ncbi:MAG TPA: hypothetical protein VGF99_08805 [Myxococcota bacterium]